MRARASSDQAGAIEDQNAAAQQLADYERALWESGGADQAALQNYLAMIGAIGSMGTRPIYRSRTRR